MTQETLGLLLAIGAAFLPFISGLLIGIDSERPKPSRWRVLSAYVLMFPAILCALLLLVRSLP